MSELTLPSSNRNSPPPVYKGSSLVIPVDTPRIVITAVPVKIPWTVKDGTVSLVSWPTLQVVPIKVWIPQYNRLENNIYYISEVWNQEILVPKRAYINGRVKYYKQEMWYEKKVVYVTDKIFLEPESSKGVGAMGTRDVRISLWERILMSIFGGGYEDTQKIDNSHSFKDGQNRFASSSGLKAEFKGLGGLLPTILQNILQIGKNSNSNKKE